MGLDKTKYIHQFIEEGLENISIVETLLFEIKDTCEAGGGLPADRQDDLVTLLRALHTLKGSARMLEFRNIEILSHEVESLFIALKENKISLSDKAVRLILAAIDELKSSIMQIKSGAADGANPSAFIKELSALCANKVFGIPGQNIAHDEIPDQPAETEFDEEDILNNDKSKYIAKFADESLENMSMVETLLFEIKGGVSVSDDLATLMRALHTVKGAARMLEFNQIETLSHALETVFLSVQEDRISLNDKAVKLILASIDEIKKGIEKVKSGKKDNIRTPVFQKELSALSANEDYEIPAEESGKKAQQQHVRLRDQVVGSGSMRDKREEAKSESIRISLGRIDEIIQSMAALQSVEIAARSIARDTETLNESSRHYSHLVSAEKSWNSPLLQEFRSIELAMSKLGSLVKNYAVDVGNHIRGAYDSIISLRMLPLSTVLDSYPRHVFTIASELGKQVKINIEGAENEIDKNLIESLSEVFLHMIRNSIDHGIEKPEERRAAGKNETGLISIRCVRESGNMKITLSDDGRGINTERIREKIVAKGLVSKEAAAALSEEELINFIFQSGFSTAEKLSHVSGRGVGMDAVRNNIERMKGSIAIQTKSAEGTVFTISVPLSMASLMGFPITVGNMKFIIPANFVDTVLLINTNEIITVVDRPGIKYGGRIIKLFYLHHILKISEDVKKDDIDTIFVVIVQAYEETVALAVNNISSMRQVILKTMPSFMEQIEMFSGVVLNEDYEMVPALHIPTIIRMARRTKTIDMKKRHVDFERLRKSVLVVDDSGPTRDIERDILEAEGYKIDTAADGAEALSAAKNTHYDLICTDIAMPNMDGFMLIENIRKNETLKDIPVIVISSKVDEKDQNRAALLGANRYILKNSFNNHNLVAAVRELIGEAHG